MNIAGMIPSSLVDYPEKVSCVVFTQGCNFQCPYCHNPDLVPIHPRPTSTDGLENALSFLNKRRGLLDGVVVSGGEPTMQKGLVSFLSRAKHEGFLVKLDTNGSNPQVLRALLDEGLVDYVAMDMKTSPNNYHPHIMKENNPNRLLASIDVIMTSAPDYEFRTTCVSPFIHQNAIMDILSCIKGARRYALQKFRPQTLLDPTFFSEPHHIIENSTLKDYQRMAGDYVEKCIIR